MLRTLLVTLGFLLSFSPALQAEQTDSQNLFQKGLAAYQNKQFDEARDDFQKLLDQGTVSAGVLHNLALTEMQLNQRPRAMALWRKALSIDPHFFPARQGRRLLEEKFNMSPWERDSADLAMRRFAESLPLTGSLLLLAALLAAGGWFWIRHFADRRRALETEQPKPTLPAMAWVLSAAFLLVAALVLLQVKVEAPLRATVVNASASLKSLPADDSVALQEIPGGSEVMVKRRQDGWSQVQNSEGATGWVKDADILLTSGWGQ
jgi:tetratricopeptide (TPR) repeat protein